MTPFSLSTLSAMFKEGWGFDLLQHELIQPPVPPKIQILGAISKETVQNGLLACAFLEALWLPENGFGRMP